MLGMELSYQLFLIIMMTYPNSTPNPDPNPDLFVSHYGSRGDYHDAVLPSHSVSGVTLAISPILASMVDPREREREKERERKRESKG
jgi:hypothetical protein